MSLFRSFSTKLQIQTAKRLRNSVRPSEKRPRQVCGISSARNRDSLPSLSALRNFWDCWEFFGSDSSFKVMLLIVCLSLCIYWQTSPFLYNVQWFFDVVILFIVDIWIFDLEHAVRVLRVEYPIQILRMEGREWILNRDRKLHTISCRRKARSLSRICF